MGTRCHLPIMMPLVRGLRPAWPSASSSRGDRRPVHMREELKPYVREPTPSTGGRKEGKKERGREGGRPQTPRAPSKPCTLRTELESETPLWTAPSGPQGRCPPPASSDAAWPARAGVGSGAYLVLHAAQAGTDRVAAAVLTLLCGVKE